MINILNNIKLCLKFSYSAVLSSEPDTINLLLLVTATFKTLEICP